MADPVILRLIGKGLRAGVLQGGVVPRTEAGTPQGGPISPVLANVDLHFVLDLWCENTFRPWCQGEAYRTRFADDGVVSCHDTREAEALHRKRRLRVARFNLGRAEEKTRLLLVGRFARERTAE
jgi:RNA-directed DNA polymerase